MQHTEQTFTDEKTMEQLVYLAEAFSLWEHLAFNSTEPALKSVHAVYLDKKQMHGKLNQWPWNRIVFPDVQRDARRHLSVEQLRNFLQVQMSGNITKFLHIFTDFTELSKQLRELEIKITESELKIMQNKNWWFGWSNDIILKLHKESIEKDRVKHFNVLQKWNECLVELNGYKELIDERPHGNKLAFDEVIVK